MVAWVEWLLVSIILSLGYATILNTLLYLFDIIQRLNFELEILNIHNISTNYLNVIISRLCS